MQTNEIEDLLLFTKKMKNGKKEKTFQHSFAYVLYNDNTIFVPTLRGP